MVLFGTATSYRSAWCRVRMSIRIVLPMSSPDLLVLGKSQPVRTTAPRTNVSLITTRLLQVEVLAEVSRQW